MVGFDQLDNRLYVPASTVTAKGDLLIATAAGVVSRHAVPATAGQTLIADPSQTDGWIADWPQDRRSAAIAPTGAIAETIPRSVQMNNTATAPTSGTLEVYGLGLPANRPITSITFFSGATNLGSGTHQWFCVVDANLNVLAKTADDISTAWAANTAKTLVVSRSISDAAITSGQATLSGTGLTSADAGRQVTVVGAGAAGVPLGTSATPVTILSVAAGVATLSANASTTVSGAVAYIGQPYTPTVAGFWYLGKVVVAGATPNTTGTSDSATNPNAVAPIMGATSTAGLTDPASLGGSAAALTAVARRVWAWAS